jgi:hypothetical protein
MVEAAVQRESNKLPGSTKLRTNPVKKPRKGVLKYSTKSFFLI